MQQVVIHLTRYDLPTSRSSSQRRYQPDLDSRARSPPDRKGRSQGIGSPDLFEDLMLWRWRHLVNLTKTQLSFDSGKSNHIKFYVTKGEVRTPKEVVMIFKTVKTKEAIIPLVTSVLGFMWMLAQRAFFAA